MSTDQNYNPDLDFAQVLKQSFDDSAQALKMLGIGGTLVPEKYDSIQLAYTGDNLTEVTYKLAGSTVAVLTLAYDGSNKLIQVTRS